MKEHKKAFTLAEVLITLGIIGVVAAITIPTLIANTNNQKYRSQFKKTVSTLSQAAKMSQAMYDFDFGGIGEKCSNDGGKDNPENSTSICALLNGTLTGATYFDSVTDLKMRKGDSILSYNANIPYSAQVWSFKDLSSFHAYTLADGSIFAFEKGLGRNACSLEIGGEIKDSGYLANEPMSYCIGFIDVNGASGPNKEVRCSIGDNSLTKNDCIVKSRDVTDIFPVRIHDGSVAPATAAVRFIMNTEK